jgi:16S rRNA (cytidine1402-2'-O)-methyltransferase
MPEKPIGVLYVVATPIGNPRDITLRALDILQSVSAIICEESRIGSTLLKKINIQSKELIELNEHNEKLKISEIIHKLALGQSLALISDCGTPVFSDPGGMLLEQVAQFNLPIVPIPGASSLMAALSILDEPLQKFIFGGFLSRQPEQRRDELVKLKAQNLPIILMDTPYRLAALLQDVEKVFGKNRKITVACDLTLKGETVFRGFVRDAVRTFNTAKKEFILIIHTH